MTTAHFRFTPSVLDGATLDNLFVARDGAIDDVLTRIRAAALHAQRSHRLFVGPRGAGKTHLIAVIHHRLTKEVEAGLRVQAAWLIEDPWDIDSYEDLLAAILDAAPDATGAVGSLEQRVIDSARDDGPIVVLTENFDQILGAIGTEGQQRLRALLENHRPLLFVATATRLASQLADQSEPFYGFFDITYLEPFTLDEARAMLIKIAERAQDHEQLRILHRPETPRRLATIAHLAGGQPRVWALLGSGLYTTQLSQLVTELISRIDDLTPYYQEQLRQLSPSEAKVVRRLAAHARPLTTTEIAGMTGVAQTSLSKTISDLRKRGWINRYESSLTRDTDRRLTYYQLAEPLARLALQVKESRGRPIGLVVEFIAAWFDLSELAGEFVDEGVGAYASAARSQYSESIMVVQALAGSAGTTEPSPPPIMPSGELIDVLCRLDDALAAHANGDPTLLLGLPAAISGLVEHLLDGVGPAADLRMDLAELATAWRLDWRARLDQLFISELETISSWKVRAHQEVMFGTPVSVDLVMGAVDDAFGVGTHLPLVMRSWISRWYRDSGDLDTASARLHGLLDQFVRAFGEDHFETFMIRNSLATLRGESGDAAGAVSDFANLLDDELRELGPDDSETLTTRHNLAFWRSETGVLAGSIAEHEAVLADRTRILGPDHPASLATRHNLARLRGKTGDLARAFADFRSVKDDCVKSVGTDHIQTLAARHNLARLRGELGDAAGAADDYDALLIDYLRVLGSSHPDTTATRRALEFWRNDKIDSGRT